MTGTPLVKACRVGVLALQGGVREHIDLLTHIGVVPAPIRKPADLVGPDGARVDAIVIPGGESSVLDRLTRLFDLAEPLRQLVGGGLPALGTCAGLILLSNRIHNPAPAQQSLGVLDVAVDRNAFGPQVQSRVTSVRSEWGQLDAAFIRAPQIAAVGPGARAVAWLDDAGGTDGGGDGRDGLAVGDAGGHGGVRPSPRIVGAIGANVIGISFHPELTGETRVHRALLDLVG